MLIISKTIRKIILGSITLFFVITYNLTVQSQKIVYIPNYLKDTNNIDGRQFSWDKTYQSENFILIGEMMLGKILKIHPGPRTCSLILSLFWTQWNIFTQPLKKIAFWMILQVPIWQSIKQLL